MNPLISDHPPAELLDRYCRRELRVAELLAVDDHLAACAQCRNRMDEIKPLRAAFAALQSDMAAAAIEQLEHLSPEQLADYVNGRADEFDRELAAGHLELCPGCRAEERNLRTAVVGPPPELSPPELSLMERVAEWWKGQMPIWRFVEAAALAAVLIWGITLWRRSQTVNPPLLAGPPSPVPTASTPLPSSSPATELLALFDGGVQVTLDGQNRWTGYEDVPPAIQSSSVESVRSGQVPLPPAPTGLRTSFGEMMGSESENSFVLRDPIGIIVLSDQPLLRWRRLPGATSYRVEIDDLTGQPRENIVTSPLLTATQWRVTSKLARGGLYRWRVVAIKDGAEIVAPVPGRPQARFKVLETSRANEIIQAQKNYAGKHLILGLLYAEAGLTAEAETELKILAANNPQSQVAQQLLRSLQQQAKRRTR